MLELTRIVGQHFVTHLTNADKYPLLVIGKDRWSFQQVASDLGVIQPKACRILSRIASDLKATSTKDLYKQTSPYSLAGTHGCGVTTLYVLLRVFGAVGLDVDGWYAKGQSEAIVTFDSLKQRELAAEHRTKEAERKRRRLRSTRQVKDLPKPKHVHRTASATM
jgi:hypothetical protein